MGEPSPILYISCICGGARRPETVDRPSKSSTLKPSPIEKTSSVDIRINLFAYRVIPQGLKKTLMSDH